MAKSVGVDELILEAIERSLANPGPLKLHGTKTNPGVFMSTGTPPPSPRLSGRSSGIDRALRRAANAVQSGAIVRRHPGGHPVPAGTRSRLQAACGDPGRRPA